MDAEPGDAVMLHYEIAFRISGVTFMVSGRFFDDRRTIALFPNQAGSNGTSGWYA
jgi:hypothetical protein